MRRRAGALAERVGALHETDPAVTRALLDAEGDRVPTWLWEPCCGRGAIVRVLAAAGHKVYASDIRAGLTGDPALDFLAFRARRPSAGSWREGIITNPPFETAALFVRHALELGTRWSAFLLPLQFFEAGNGVGELADARRFVLDAWPPARCWVFANRIPRMHRDGWDGEKATNMEAFAWFVWDRRSDPAAGTVIRRIRWRALAGQVESPQPPGPSSGRG